MRKEKTATKQTIIALFCSFINKNKTHYYVLYEIDFPNLC